LSIAIESQMSEVQEAKANKDNDDEDEVSLSFLPSPRVEERLQKVGIREDLMEFVTKVI
jgi:hypothetical protein